MDEHRAASSAAVTIRPYAGNRNEIRSLFELAEDSAMALDSSIDDGAVLVAETFQGRGIGRSLVSAALTSARDAGAARLCVATAAADTANLRFYQRQGFRMYAIERDAFTAATGYPSAIVIDGIALCDRVWLDHPL